MPYIGNASANRFVASKAATQFSGDGSTTAFTLEHAVGSDEDILVSVDGVIQEPSVAYAVSSGTTLTFTAAPSSNSGNNIFVYYLFRTVATVDHPATSALSATSGTFSTNATIAGTLGVTGATTLTGALTVNDPIQILNGSNVNTASTDADDLIIEGPNDCGLSILSATTGRIFFGDASNDDAGSIRYVHTDDSMRFEANDEEAMRIHSIGAVTKPLQPAFNVTMDGDQNNMTVGGSDNTIIEFDSERFDQNADFNPSTYTFTAPVTGRYLLSYSIRMQNIDTASTSVSIILTTSNRGYATYQDMAGFASDFDYYPFTTTLLVDMDVNDTASVNYYVNGGAAQNDISQYSYFTGYLVC